jgi:hypothetical protein
MLRRAIRCLAPAGPAWTTFKSLVDQGAIPNVDAGKAEAVFATLSSDQLKQLADAAASIPAATEVTATPATRRNTNGSKRRNTNGSKRRVPRINLGISLRRDLRMMLAAEKVHLRNAGATKATFAALSKSERDALAQEVRSVAEFPANAALNEVARALTLLYNVEKGGKVPYENLSQKQRTLLRGLAYALKNTRARVTLEQVGYVLQHAPNMGAFRSEAALPLIRHYRKRQ